LEDLTPQLSRRLGISRDIKGVIVSEVDPSSPAADAGLRRGDIIQRVNRQPVTTTKEVEGILRQGSGKPVLLLVNRGGNTAFIVVEAGK
jgi:S1-C subfamily serine protease